MINSRLNPKAQSILEYVIILTVILAAVILGTVAIKKSLIGTATKGEEVPEASSLFGKTGKVISDYTGELKKIGQPKTP